MVRELFMALFDASGCLGTLFDMFVDVETGPNGI